MVDSVTITMINDFTPIEVKDLPAAVQGYAEDIPLDNQKQVGFYLSLIHIFRDA